MQTLLFVGLYEEITAQVLFQILRSNTKPYYVALNVPPHALNILSVNVSVVRLHEVLRMVDCPVPISLGIQRTVGPPLVGGGPIFKNVRDEYVLTASLRVTLLVDERDDKTFFGDVFNSPEEPHLLGDAARNTL